MEEEFFIENTENTEIHQEEDKPQPKKKGKGMSEERRRQLLENLRRGRETSMKNRQIRAEKRKEVKKKLEDKYIETVDLSQEVANLKNELKEAKNNKDKEEIENLKNEIKELKKILLEQKTLNKSIVNPEEKNFNKGDIQEHEKSEIIEPVINEEKPIEKSKPINIPITNNRTTITRLRRF